MDEYVDLLLREDQFCGITLPRIQKRWALEEQNLLKVRVSTLEHGENEIESE